MEINKDAYLADLFGRKEQVYDICKDIADCVGRTTGEVLGMTRSWSMHELVKSRDIARKDRIAWWVYRKALKAKDAPE